VRIGARSYLDGGILDRPGLASVTAAERVLFHHLPSRSPWRRPGSPALAVPRRQNMHVVAVPGLPRLNPFRLERGPEAIELAAQGLRLALTRQVAPDGSPIVAAAPV
jgi:NTE family protein